MVVSIVENGDLRLRLVQSVMQELRSKAQPFLRAAGMSFDILITERRAEDEQANSTALAQRPAVAAE